MVRRDILARYRGSFGGALWTFLNPLLLMATYAFVFGVVLQDSASARIPPASAIVLYFLAGMLPWLAFSEAVGRAPYVILGPEFRQETGVSAGNAAGELVISGAVTEVFGLLIFFAGLLAARHADSGRGGVAAGADHPAASADGWVVLVPGRAGNFRARPGRGDRLRADAVVFPDADLLSRRRAGPAFRTAPCAFFRESRCTFWCAAIAQIFLENHAPNFAPIAALWVASTAVAILGYAWFHRLRRSFADVI